MTPRQALLHVRTLIRAADDAEARRVVRRLHAEMLEIVERGLEDDSNVLTFRSRRSDMGDV